METDFHSPTAVVDSLREILVVDKLPIGFLLGAGCSSSIKTGNDGASLIPDARGLTKAVLDQCSNPNLDKLLKCLQEMLVKDGQENPNIEHMLTHVRAMQAVVGKDNVRSFSLSDLKNLEQFICESVFRTVNKSLPGPMTPYHYLARWIGQRANRTVIFTTNYDLLVEQALEALQVPFFDGFIGSYQPFFHQQAIEQDDLPSQWNLICKLHGSINWRLVQNSNDIVRNLDDKAGDKLIIHPSHLKYAESRRMPYFVMLDRLKAFIRNDKKPAALFTIGYSFSDEHINDVIADSLRDNPSAISYALQYDRLSACPQVTKLTQRCANLHVLAPGEAITKGRLSRWEKCSPEQVTELRYAFRAQSSKEGSSDQGNGAADDRKVVEFCLGDFNNFGYFLGSFSPSQTLLMGESEATL